MSSDSLILGLPDLVVRMTRDGVVLAAQGGRAVGALRPAEPCVGQSADDIWPEHVAMLARQLARKAISSRTDAQGRFQERGRDYALHVSAQGPDRVLIVLRLMSEPQEQQDDTSTTLEPLGPRIDRRGFMRRFRESVATAGLREQPLALAIIPIDGIAEIAQSVTPAVAEQLMTAAIQRLPMPATGVDAPATDWYLGQLGDSNLAVVLNSGDRKAIEATLALLCESLRQPLQVGSNRYQLGVAVGVALLGVDSKAARTLIDQARSAAHEARRAGSSRALFFSDTLRLKSLARLDIVQELRDALSNGELRYRYVGRYEIGTGQLVACVAEPVWNHPLRGAIPGAEVLRLAQSTGLSSELARESLRWLQQDYGRARAAWPRGVRLSYGVLRHHLANPEFAADIERLLAAGPIPADHLELRITEREFGLRPPGELKSLADRGIAIIVEGIGGAGVPLPWLAQAPIAALQCDPVWTAKAHNDEPARKICQAVVALARAFNLRSIASAVDTAGSRDALREIGFDQGVGALFPALTLI